MERYLVNTDVFMDLRAFQLALLTMCDISSRYRCSATIVVPEQAPMCFEALRRTLGDPVIRQLKRGGSICLGEDDTRTTLVFESAIEMIRAKVVLTINSDRRAIERIESGCDLEGLIVLSSEFDTVAAWVEDTRPILLAQGSAWESP